MSHSCHNLTRAITTGVVKMAKAGNTSLPPFIHRCMSQAMDMPKISPLPAHQPSFGTQGLDLSRFALERDQRGESSSSPFQQPLQSSPAFNASHRRPGPYDFPRTSRPLVRRSLNAVYEQNSGYEPLGVEELQAEERDLHAPQIDEAERFQPSYHAPPQIVKSKPNPSATPVVQGNQLGFHSCSPRPLPSCVSLPALQRYTVEIFRDDIQHQRQLCSICTNGKRQDGGAGTGNLPHCQRICSGLLQDCLPSANQVALL